MTFQPSLEHAGANIRIVAFSELWDKNEKIFQMFQN